MLTQNSNLPLIGGISFGIVILCVIALIVITLWEKWQNKKQTEALPSQEEKVVETDKKIINPQVYGMNVENTLKMLDMIVSQQTTYYVEYTMIIKDPIYVNDKTFEKAVTNIINNIYQILSPDYIDVLHHYFSPEGLVKYLYAIIYPVVVKVSLEKNKLK